ncbi:hypothetical protein LJR290_007766 [Variovorax sp. LjRoot290]|uniref:hypothetical protein n=1 Tax=unclassified Variovorax TaxID=663243 RepID=UPI003ECD44C6
MRKAQSASAGILVLQGRGGCQGKLPFLALNGRANRPSQAGFIALIRHKYLTLDGEAGLSIAEVCDYLGFEAFAHSTGNSPPDSSRRPNLAAMAPNDAIAREHIQGLPTKLGTATASA